MVKKAEKSGVKVTVVEPKRCSSLNGISKIYNETPIRQGRAFSALQRKVGNGSWQHV